MLGFSGTIFRGRFAIGVCLRIGFYVAATVGFPFLLIALAPAFHCSPGVASDNCGIAGLIISMAYKPLVFALFVFSFPGILVRRFRDLGVSPWWTLFVLLMLCTDNQFLIFAGTPWTFGFSAGALSIARPDFLLEALALLLALSIVPGREGRVALRSLGWPAYSAILVAAVAALAAAVRLALSQPGLVAGILPLLRPIYLIMLAAPVPLLLLPFIAAFALWPRSGESLETERPAASYPPIPFLLIGIVALIFTFTVMMIVDRQLRDPMFIIVGLVQVVLPTFALYFGLCLTVYLLLWQRNRRGLALGAVIVVVLGTWAYGHWQTLAMHQADADAIAATGKVPLTAIPSVVLVDEPNSSFRSILLKRSDIEAVVYRDNNGRLTEYRAAAKGYEPTRATISALPSTYLSLKTYLASDFRADRTRYEMEGPYELRVVNDGKEDLVALWYRREIYTPYWLPVLSLRGWMGSNTTYSDDVSRIKNGFVADALGVVPPREKGSTAPRKPALSNLVHFNDTENQK